jgi:hypothetical protein
MLLKFIDVAVIGKGIKDAWHRMLILSFRQTRLKRSRWRGIDLGSLVMSSCHLDY